MVGTADQLRALRLWAGLALIILLSSALFLLSTRWGMGVRPDSIFYLRLPGIVHTNAPAYAWLLDVVALIIAPLGLSKLDGAAISNFVLLLCNVGIVWWIILRGTGRTSLAFLGGLLCVSAPMFLDLHVTILSEGLFVFCILICLVMLTRYVETPTFAPVVVAGLAAGFATLTRFNGVPLIVLGPLVIAFSSRPIGIRVRDGLLFLLAAVGMLVAYLIAQQWTGSPGLGREMALNGGFSATVLNQGVSSLLSLLIPLAAIPAIVRPILLAVFMIVALWAIAIYAARWASRRRSGTENAPFETFPLIAATFVLGHLMFLVLSLLIEANLPLKPSYMLPVYVVGVAAGILLVAGGAAPRLGRPLRLGLVALTVLLLGLNFLRTGVLVREFREEGIFYASPSWRNSPTIRKVAALSSEIDVYSNGPDALSFLLPGRRVDWVPAKFDRRTGKDWANQSFEERLGVMREKLEERRAVVVFLNKIEWRFYLPTEQDLVETLRLVPLAREADGTIYELKDARRAGVKL